MFVNSLVLRTRIVSGETFDALLERVRTTDLEAFANSDVPFETVADALDPVRSEAFAPLAQIALSFNPGASVDGADVTVDDLRVAPIAAPLVPAHQDMTVVVTSGPAGEPWSAMATYATDLFGEPGVLDARSADPAARCRHRRSRAGGRRRRSARRRRARTGACRLGRSPADTAAGTVAAALASALTATAPERTAVVFGDRTVTYGEFAAYVNTTARQLISAGVGPDTAVGLSFGRGVEMAVAIHAVLVARRAVRSGCTRRAGRSRCVHL